MDLIRKVGAKDYAIGVLVIVVIAFAQKLSSDHAEIVKAREVYEHPQIKYIDRVVVKAGPVRIRTITIRAKDGNERIERIEDRGEVVTAAETDQESVPVSIAVALREPRSDRYLVSAGFNRLAPSIDGKALFVGYGWKNRFDLQVGAVQHAGFSPWILATVRF